MSKRFKLHHNQIYMIDLICISACVCLGLRAVELKYESKVTDFNILTIFYINFKYNIYIEFLANIVNAVYCGIPRYRKTYTFTVPKSIGTVSYRTATCGIPQIRYFRHFFSTISAVFRYYGIFSQPQILRPC